ncbi:hypothetical protein COOONC_26001, partial [Cooperia oncophora]
LFTHTILSFLLSVFFADKSSGIWVSAPDDSAFKIKSKGKEGNREAVGVFPGANATIEESESIKPVVLITRPPSTGEFSKGDLVYADPKERHPFLCSRGAAYFESGIEQLASSAKQLGFSTTMAKDRNGDDRPFLVFDNVFAVEATKFGADYKSFDHICDVRLAFALIALLWTSARKIRMNPRLSMCHDISVLELHTSQRFCQYD